MATGLYDIHIELKHWPLLEQDPTTRIYMLDVRHVMTHDPVTVPLVWETCCNML